MLKFFILYLLLGSLHCLYLEHLAIYLELNDSDIETHFQNNTLPVLYYNAIAGMIFTPVAYILDHINGFIYKFIYGGKDNG